MFVATFNSLKAMEDKSVSNLFERTDDSWFWTGLEKEISELPSDCKMYNMSSLGRLLEDLMYSSKSLKACLKDFGNSSAIRSEFMSFVLLQIPLVGGTIYTTMEFYGMGKIVKSEHIETDEKVEEVVKTVTKVTMSLGSAVGGGIVGQILIPIPLLGAFIGGVVGGAIGTVFGKALDKITSQVPIKFTKLATCILMSRSQEGSWSFDSFDGQVKTTLARLHAITLPSNVDQKLWINIICFIIVSVYIMLLEKNAKESQEEQELTHAEALNEVLEKTIVYFSKRIDLLEYEASIVKINQSIGMLAKEGMIEFDLK